MRQAVAFLCEYGPRLWWKPCAKCVMVNRRGVALFGGSSDGKFGGHQVCAAFGAACQEPIVNKRVGYCHAHAAKFYGMCRVGGCTREARRWYESCGIPEHMALEDDFVQRKMKKNAKKKANVLKKGLGRTSTSAEHDGDIPRADGDAGLRGRFGYVYLPCLQVIATSCGIILGMKKLFTKEAARDVADFVRETWMRLERIPDVVFYDRACILHPFMTNNSSEYEICYKNTLWKVDRFHFNVGHSDNRCETVYNPDVLDLYDKDGNRLFNTSICESVNSWLGSILAVIFNMDGDLHDFILWYFIHLKNSRLRSQQCRDACRNGTADVTGGDISSRLESLEISDCPSNKSTV